VPDFSPDGRLRLDVRADSREQDLNPQIRVAPADADTWLVVATGDQPQWSPDGAWIVFTADVDVRLSEVERLQVVEDANIYRVRPDGSELTALTESPEVDGNPRWSPDGARILFTRFDRTGYRALMTMESDGSDQRAVLTDGAYFGAWSPDGAWILFNPDLKMHTVRPDGSDRHPLAEGLPVAWTPNGSAVLYSRDSDIRFIRTDGSDDRVVLEGATGNRAAGDAHAKWSPDGSLVAVALNGPCADGLVSGIVVLDSTGVVVRDLRQSWSPCTRAAYYLGQVSWSPLGDTLFAKSIVGGRVELVAVSLDGGDRRTVRADGGGERCADPPRH
jgi:Tol biopolymer transport system component